jgi:hypothetical protein
MHVGSLQDRLDAAPVFTPAVEPWGTPDMSVLVGGRTPPVSMSRAVFGDLWPLVADLAEGTGSPVDYVGCSLLAVAASLIGSKRRVQPFASAPLWRDPPVLWVALVGDPSSNKSPAIDAVVAPLRAIELDYAEAHKLALVAHQAVAERAKAERSRWQDAVKTATRDGASTPGMPPAAELPDDPVRRRLLVQDATPESMCELLASNTNGMLHMRDELSGWLSSFERYSPGGRDFWLEAYGGRSFVVDRKSAKGPVTIPFNGVSVLGGIQPEKLTECLLSTADDGLVPRFVWAWPDPIRYTRPRSVADRGRLDAIYRRLLNLQAIRGSDGAHQPATLMLDAAAGDMFEAWIVENNASVSDSASLQKGFCGKMKGTVLRLALTVELLRWADGGGPEPQHVSAMTLADVLEFVEDYAKPTAQRVFGDAGLPPVERNAAALAKYIRKTGATSINVRDVRRSAGIPQLKDTDAAEAACAALVEADWLKHGPTRAGVSAGRARKDFAVNPAVLDGPGAELA